MGSLEKNRVENVKRSRVGKHGNIIDLMGK